MMKHLQREIKTHMSLSHPNIVKMFAHLALETDQVGIVMEYLHDDRDERAFDTLFEHDVAMGARFTWHDANDSNALVGLIWDADTGERIWSVEAHRQLGPAWSLRMEGRVFSGSRTVPRGDPFRAVTDTDHRAAFLQREDFLQIEFVRYF